MKNMDHFDRGMLCSCLQSRLQFLSFVAMDKKKSRDHRADKGTIVAQNEQSEPMTPTEQLKRIMRESRLTSAHAEMIKYNSKVRVIYIGHSRPDAIVYSNAQPSHLCLGFGQTDSSESVGE